MYFFRHFLGTYFVESIGHALRGSVLFAAVLLLLTSSGTWKYLASTVTAHEMNRSAAWTRTVDMAHLPLVIAIDDAGYEKFFDTKSPVARDRVLALLKTISEHTQPTTRVLIDIDLSPAPGQARGQGELEQFLLQNPGKWVLPAVRGGNNEADVMLGKWRSGLCARGIRFGLPYIPNEFGYPKPTHQYQDSLADAVGRTGVCGDPASAMILKAMPLHPMYLKTGLVIPFSGELELLAGMLDAVSPELIVLGGAWGQSDMFATPFGDRYGAQIHGAALAGALAGERLAPPWAELLISWTFVSLVSTILFYVSRYLNRHTAGMPGFMVGHAFFALRLKPIIMTVLVCCALFGLMEVLAILHAATGLWVSAARLSGYTIVWLVIPWNLGRTAPARVENWKALFREQLVTPLREDIDSIAQSTRIICKRSPSWMDGGAAILISRPRAVFEGGCSLVSLLMQSVVPVASLLYILYGML